MKPSCESDESANILKGVFATQSKIKSIAAP